MRPIVRNGAQGDGAGIGEAAAFGTMDALGHGEGVALETADGKGAGVDRTPESAGKNMMASTTPPYDGTRPRLSFLR